MKKKLLVTLSAALLASLSLGMFAACGNSSPSGGEKEPPSIEETISNHEHKYDAREICTVCGYTENGTEGLEYEYSEWRNHYYVGGIGTATETDIIIPSVYDDGEHGKLFVWSISEGAFQNCTKITSVTIGYGVTTFGSAASNVEGTFSGCSNLTSATIPSSFSWIGSYAFEGCRNLTKVSIPNSITEIGHSAFENCSKLQNLIIPDSVTTINEKAFSGCDKLIQKHNSVHYIGKWVVGCDDSAKSVSIRKNTVAIADSAFEGHENLVSVTISKGIKKISRAAFYGCTGLTSVSIPNTVTKIDYWAFTGCTGLTSFTIPESVSYIADTAFSGCSGLIKTEKGVYYVDKWVIGFDPDYDDSKVSHDYTLRNDTIGIAGSTYHERNMNSISIPTSLKYINRTFDSSIFQNQPRLKIYISDLASWCQIQFSTSIASFSLYLNNEYVSELTIPQEISEIPSYSFANCKSLSKVTIPRNIKSIGNSAFYGCTGLTKIYYLGEIASWCEISGLQNIMSADRALIINGNRLSGNLNIPDGVKKITDHAFSNCSGLTSINIPNSVTSIGNHAFYGCSGLTSITIPNSVTSIGSYAFYYCSGLTSITYKGTIEEWNAIKKGYNWNYKTGGYTVHCKDGDIAK